MSNVAPYIPRTAFEALIVRAALALAAECVPVTFASVADRIGVPPYIVESLYYAIRAVETGPDSPPVQAPAAVVEPAPGGHDWEYTREKRVWRCRSCGMCAGRPTEVLLTCQEWRDDARWRARGFARRNGKTL